LCSHGKKAEPFKEEFARFLEEPSREELRNLLAWNPGELPQLDFKADWPDMPKLVRHILGLSNSNGGCLVLGVAERADKTLEPQGLPKIHDKNEIAQGRRKFLPGPLMEIIHIMDFTYRASEYGVLDGKSFQVLIVPDAPENVPFIPIGETTGIRRTSIYVRRMAATEEASYEELQALLNRKLATGESNQSALDLGAALKELRFLYAELNRCHIEDPGSLAASNLFRVRLHADYPSESYPKFLCRLISQKKLQIQTLH
jgi:predicted HTH transcriptional regulator